MKQQKGFIEVAILLGLLLALWFIWPQQFEQSRSNQCQSGLVEQATKQINLPPYTSRSGVDRNAAPKPFGRVRKDVIIDQDFFIGNYGHLIKYTTVQVDGKDYNVYYLRSQGIGGEVTYPPKIESKYRFPGRVSDQLYFYDFRLIFLVATDNVPYDTGTKKTVSMSDGKSPDNSELIVWRTDIYQDLDDFNSPHPLPDDVFVCPLNPAFQSSNKLVYPTQSVSTDRKQLQLEYFELESELGWTVHCKPAIYLYPQNKQYINVQVHTKGELIYTKPNYPLYGWTALVSPDGTLTVDGMIYPYLYYESKVPDSLIQKPKTGYVVTNLELPNLFSTILPQLGLTGEQTQDFKNYWEKTLPQSPYYFVGIMDQTNINEIEPLVITPSPQTSIRVRLYFQLLEHKIDVQNPLITTPKKTGFTMIEWGGMVKTDTNHPFTCSQ